MKEIRNGTTLFLLLVLIFAFSAYGSLSFFQFDSRNSQYSSLGTERVLPLRKNVLPPSSTPRTGIIPPIRNPRGSIEEIIDEQSQYFPGSDIHIKNQFIFSKYNDTHDLVIVQQEILIFLFEASVDLQTMINVGNSTDPKSSDHYVHNASTNGVNESTAALSTDPTHGFIDTTFQIPVLGELNNIDIYSDDNVTIFQYYPAKNVSLALIGDIIYLTDNFTLSAVAEFSSDGFVNDDHTQSANTFRQGENATAILNAKTGTTPIENVTVISCKLYNGSTDEEIPNLAYGLQYALLDVSGNPNDTTDENGVLKLFVDTTYPTTPEGDYYFNLTADFQGTGFYTENFQSPDPNTNIANISVDFTVRNDMDIVTDALFQITADPPSITTPDIKYTIVTVQIQADYAYGSQYNLENIPVNATLNIQEPWVNISFAAGVYNNGSVDWGLTNSNGEVKFNITAGFPIPWESKTPTITVIADLQNTSEPIYPPGEPHRFLENSTGGKIITKPEMFSIDPDFWIGQITREWRNTTSIRPGEAAELHYEVRKKDEPPGTNTFAGVPVNITLDVPIPGVSLDMTDNNPYGNGYYYTDGSGIIILIISTTYLLTPELVQAVELNLTVDFENDSEVRWIGEDHKGYGSFEDFDETWLSVTRDSDLTIDPNFTNCSIVFNATSEPLDDTVIRPGDPLTITFKVQGGGAGLEDVPVNISLNPAMGPYPGVSLKINTYGASDPRPDYYKTAADGLISVNITTNYGETPKDLEIYLNATADFQNDSHVIYDIWYVGSKGEKSDFRSNSSYSVFEQIITVDPQYFTGYIFVPADNPPKELVQQNDTLDIEFRLKLNFTGGDVFPDIDGVNISIQINNTDPTYWNMTVTPLESYQNSINSSVIFIIKTNTTGITPEAIYNITATADFGSIKDKTYNFSLPYPSTVPTGYLAGVWVNGTDATGNYSYVTETFEVKNIDIIRVWIPGGGITDSSHGDAGYNAISGFYEVYRGTSTITIEGSYKDNTQEPVVGRQITVSLNHTGNLGAPDYLANNITDGDGLFSVTVTLPTDTPLEDDVMIYGWDSDSPPPPIQEGREGEDRIRVVSTIDLSDYDISDYTGNSVFVGGSVYANGTLIDDQGVPIGSASSAHSISSSELDEHIRVIGWNGTHEIGQAVNNSPNFDGTYGMYYYIPPNFTGENLTIMLNITSHVGLDHYRVNGSEKLVFVYRDFQVPDLQCELSVNGSIFLITNNTEYLIIEGGSQTITINGTLQDLRGRGLNAKEISYEWDDAPTSTYAGAGGSFTYTSPPLSVWVDATHVWEFYHILDNGTVLSDHFVVTFRWEVKDTTNPTISITSPINITTNGILPPGATTIIIATVEDPGPTTGPGYVSDGLDNSSVTIWIDDVSSSMSQQTGSFIFSFDWDTSSPKDGFYNITIRASDLAGNTYRIVYDEIVIDIINPLATMEVTENEKGYLIINSDGKVVISGTITDSGSITGKNSGVNETSVNLVIQNSTGYMFNVSNANIDINQNNYSYSWNIFNPTTQVRNPLFTTSIQWMIVVTLEDGTGNSNQTELNILLDNIPPPLKISDELPKKLKSGDLLILNVTFSDDQSGLMADTLTFELILNSSMEVLKTFQHEDPDITPTETGASLFLNISEVLDILEDRDIPEEDRDGYFIRISIYDRTANQGQINSLLFEISQPGAPSILENLLIVIISPILAFGGGIGLAALYERFKGIRSA